MHPRAIPLLTILLLAAPALGDEGDREIKLQRQLADDLTGLDAHKVVADEIALLRGWIDEAAARLAKDQPERAREVLDRCTAQTELVRAKLETATVVAQAVEREKAAQAAHDKLKRTRKSLEEAQARKKALMEANPK